VFWEYQDIAWFHQVVSEPFIVDEKARGGGDHPARSLVEHIYRNEEGLSV
jgi:hypothetical protein